MIPATMNDTTQTELPLLDARFTAYYATGCVWTPHS